MPHKSSRRRAYAQRIVATRLLYRLHDPAGRVGRMQRIRPRSTSNCKSPIATPWLPPGAAGVGLLRSKGQRPIRTRLRGAGEGSPRSGMDSDLEAFSHNPADGSVAALPGQTAAETNYPNQRFLSY